jgi:hypothetical protein
MFVALVAAHYVFFTLHPFFNRSLTWKVKGGWAAFKLMLYPIVAPLYAWFGIET